jgi:hypothetical protein
MNSFHDVCLFISLLLYSVSAIWIHDISRDEVLSRVTVLSKNLWYKATCLTCLNVFIQWGEVLLSFHKLPKNNDSLSKKKLFFNILFFFKMEDNLR